MWIRLPLRPRVGQGRQYLPATTAPRSWPEHYCQEGGPSSIQKNVKPLDCPRPRKLDFAAATERWETMLRSDSSFRTSASTFVMGALIAVTLAAVPAEAARPRCDGRVATVTGTAQADRLRGTPGADVIVARGGADRV